MFPGRGVLPPGDFSLKRATARADLRGILTAMRRLIHLIAGLVGLAAFALSSASADRPEFTVTEASTGDAASRERVRVDTSGGAVGADVVTVSQKEKSFAPGVVQLRTGSALAILNDDDVVHNVYCRAGDFKYNSGPQQPGVRATITFSAPGRYEVRCAIHPKMLLTVEVAD